MVISPPGVKSAMSLVAGAISTSRLRSRSTRSPTGTFCFASQSIHCSLAEM